MKQIYNKIICLAFLSVIIKLGKFVQFLCSNTFYLFQQSMPVAVVVLFPLTMKPLSLVMHLLVVYNYLFLHGPSLVRELLTNGMLMSLVTQPLLTALSFKCLNQTLPKTMSIMLSMETHTKETTQIIIE